MAEPNNINVAADAYTLAAGIGRLSAAEREFYTAAARTYATRAPTNQNAQFWTDLAALIAASASSGTPAAVAAVAAIKRSGLSVSASTQSQLHAIARDVAPRVTAIASSGAWLWLAAGGVGLWLLARKRGRAA